MPTAAKLVAAVALAIAAYGVSTVVLYHSEPFQTSGGLSHNLFAAVGFVIGWSRLGPAAERGYMSGWAGGVGASVTVFVSMVILGACIHVYSGFEYHAYRTLSEMIDGFFSKAIEYAGYMTNWEIFVVTFVGGFLAGTFAAMAGRLWR